MSRYEHVFIDTAAGIDEVAATVARVAGGALAGTDQEGDVRIELSETAVAFLGSSEYVDEPGRPVGQYRYRVLVRDIDRRQSWHGAQMAAARRLYNALAEQTGWALMLLFDDRAELVDTRPALARSA